MARLKLSEYRAKKLLIPNYKGVALELDSLEADLAKLNKGTTYAVKVDQGIKKRGKQGLLELGVESSNVHDAVVKLSKRGFKRFLVEPMISHQPDDELYACFERQRDGVVISFSTHGGIGVEEYATDIKQMNANEVESEKYLKREFIDHVVSVMNQNHMSFVEINPLLKMDDKYILLDAAVLVDSAGSHQSNWQDSDLVEGDVASNAEQLIKDLNDSSPASFSFKILNPDAPLWLLLSGGGASITLADEAASVGSDNLIGNYGEYSGGPTAQETYLYARQVIKCMLDSKAPKKSLVVAGGVANFTDVSKTFAGIIRALDEVAPALKEQNIKVFVRRGGPNEAEGLLRMDQFLSGKQALGSVHGSDTLLTKVIHEALEYLDA